MRVITSYQENGVEYLVSFALLFYFKFFFLDFGVCSRHHAYQENGVEYLVMCVCVFACVCVCKIDVERLVCVRVCVYNRLVCVRACV